MNKRLNNKKPPYCCPRCGYRTRIKNDMRKHFYTTRKQCPALKCNIDLNEDIYQDVLENRVLQCPALIVLNDGNTQPSTTAALKTITKQITEIRLELDAMRPRQKEKIYQDILSKHFQAGHQKGLHGITDITTDNMHIEIKLWSMYKQAAGQLFFYNAANPKRDMRVYLFGDPPTGATKKRIADDFCSAGIKAFEIHVAENRLVTTNLCSGEQEIIEIQ